jgi:hypothetical protein
MQMDLPTAFRVHYSKWQKKRKQFIEIDFTENETRINSVNNSTVHFSTCFNIWIGTVVSNKFWSSMSFQNLKNFPV